MKFNPMF